MYEAHQYPVVGHLIVGKPHGLLQMPVLSNATRGLCEQLDVAGRLSVVVVVVVTLTLLALGRDVLFALSRLRGLGFLA